MNCGRIYDIIFGGDLKIFFILFIIAALLICTLADPAFFEAPEAEEQSTAQSLPQKEPRGLTKAVWLSQYDLCDVYFDGKEQRRTSEFSSLVGKMLDNCAALGFDTVIVQVRPNGDSMYPSSLFCPSLYVVGEYGEKFEYDPFSVIISLAQARGLSVHAWVNPLRLMTVPQIESVGEEYIVGKWWRDDEKRGKYIVEFENRLYLNPAYAEVRRLIASGAAEVARRYPVDGVHIDDYFYPHGIGADFDSEAYAIYADGAPLFQWRRENISALVKAMHDSVKAVSEDLLFGVSPGGNLSTAYSVDCADVYKWCAVGGYVDYICPQIYFGLLHETCAFDATYEKWEGVVSGSAVELYVGITLGKAVNGALGIDDPYAGSGRAEWIESDRVLADCLEFLQNKASLCGIAVFCYGYFYDPVSGEPNGALGAELENFLPVFGGM